MNQPNPSMLTTMMQRKSVRGFTEQSVEPEKMEQIYDAILAAPTTENMFMYTVIPVKDPDVRGQLSKQPAIRRAPEVLVFCADYRRWSKLFQGTSEGGRMPQQGEYQLAVIDATIAAQNAVLAAEALGLSSVYLGDIMEHYEQRACALGLPAGVVPVLTLCIGYALSAQLERAPTKRYERKYIIHEHGYVDYSREELLEMVQSRNQYPQPELLTQWLEKFAKRCTKGAGALDRTRSIVQAIARMEAMQLDETDLIQLPE